MNLKSVVTIITLNDPNTEDFALARNQLLEQVKTDWVLFLDSDEIISPALEQEIMQAVKSDKYEAYYIPRLDTFLGRQLCHGETGHAQFIRLGKKTYGKWVRPVHELWEGRGNPARVAEVIGHLHNSILHTPHHDIYTFLMKINHYSDLESVFRYKQGRRANLFHVFVYPLAKFKLNYLVRLGFLDGVPGLIHALMMSFHSYLTWTKLYLLSHKQ